MLPVVLAAVLILPGIGVLLMELGAPGLNLTEIGLPNGATAAYGLHVVVFVFAYLLLRRRRSVALHTIYPSDRFRRLALIIVTMTVTFILFVVFVVGARDVLTGATSKGDFRSSLGVFGFPVFLGRDFVVPMLGATAAYVYTRSSRSRLDTALMALVVLCVATSTAVWGYKAGAVVTTIPALIVLFPRVRPLTIVVVGLVASAAILAAAMVFERVSAQQAATLVLIRGTVGAGDTAWKIWDLRAAGTPLPPYLPTLQTALGSRVASILGLFQKSNDLQYATVDFWDMTTNLVKGFNPNIEFGGTNVTATVFGEGVLALGSPGYLLFSVVAGLVAAMVANALDRARAAARPVIVALVAVYFNISVFDWLNSGGITLLFGLPRIVDYTIAALIALLLLRLVGIAAVPRRSVNAEPLPA